MRWRFIVGVAVMLATGLVPVARAEAPTLQSEYLDIYLKMNEAAKMEMAGDDRNALASFEDCYTHLQRIHANNPNWEAALVLQRMNDCRASIVALEAKLAPPPGKAVVATTTNAPAATPPPDSPQAQLAGLVAAAKASPSDASAQFNLGTAYYQVGQTDAAITTLQRGLVLEPGNIYGRNYLGCAFLRKGRIESAAKEFQKAIALVETFAEAHYNLAILYATEDPPATVSARAQYKRALELGIAPDPHLEKVLRMAGR